MIDVCFTTSSCDAALMDHIAHVLARHLRLVSGPDAPHAAPLYVTSKRLPGPFIVHPKRGAVVSTWESAGVSRYAGIASGDYLLIASLLALAQWRALRANPLLRVEDFRHPPGVRCLFAAPRRVQDFAPLLNPPAVCRGCTEFYHCLGAESELIALRQVIAEVLATRNGALADFAAARRN